jgi:SecD/SecF fusion protein
VYQISYTFVSNSVEKKVEKEVDNELDDYKERASKTGDTIVIDGILIDFRKPEGEENARTALINKKLKEKGDAPVYPLLGSSFSTVKKRSMAFGLDLVGGMSVTMEINIPEMLKSYAKERDPKFRKVFDAAMAEYSVRGGDFIKIFADKHNKINKGLSLVSLFSLIDNEELNVKSTDAEVLKFLNDRVKSSMDGIEEIIDRRVNQFGVSQPNIQKDEQNNRLYVELPGVQDEKTVAEQLQSTANLQFFETYASQEIAQNWESAVLLSSQKEVTVSSDDTTEVDSTPVSLDQLGDLNNTGVKGLRELLIPRSDNPFAAFATIEDRTLVDQILARNDIKQAFPEDLKFMWSADPEVLDKKPGYILYAIKIPASGKHE